MSGPDGNPALTRALELSRELLVFAESGDVCKAAALDAERLGLLRAAKSASQPLSAYHRDVLSEIAGLNDRAIGYLEHRCRIKAREMDTATLGRRAVNAYGLQRQGSPQP
jgi:hypothetical protein